MSMMKTTVKGLVVLAVAFSLVGLVNAQGHEGGLGELKVHLNIADVDQLLKIEGMTEELAEAIVEYRENTGYFNKPEDLLNVSGMTQERYEELDPQMGVEGDLYCVRPEGDEDGDDEDEEPPLSPSKC
jgi:competence ComEA-like helix-hairpin-helix protein